MSGSPFPLRARTRIARRLRRNATEVETRLWWALREMGKRHRFRRQHPIGRYIVDFACPGLKLAIELDGGQHALRQREDAARTAELARRGCRLIRFWNGDVIGNLAGVLEKITNELNALSALQGGEGGDPSRERRGG